MIDRVSGTTAARWLGRRAAAVAFFALVTSVATVGCGSDDDSIAPGDGDGGASDATTDASADAGALDTGIPVGDGGGVVSCISGSTGPDGGLSAGCTSLEQCAEASCNDVFTAAFGADWAHGTVSGSCETFYGCTAGAGCTTAAATGCESTVNLACAASLNGISSCLESNCATATAACNASLGSPLDAGALPSDGG